MPRNSSSPVALKTLEELESSLIALAETYATHPELRTGCREAVINAKDRARFAANNAKAAPDKRAAKREMVEWMLVWLGDPAMFATWALLRKRAAYCSSTDST